MLAPRRPEPPTCTSITNARAEGYNRRIKQIKHVSYGLRNLPDQAVTRWGAAGRRGYGPGVPKTDLDALRRSCTRFLNAHGPLTARAALQAMLEDVPDDFATDTYGEGGPVEQLEGEVAALLGKEAAAFFPSGTMAQQIALRLWCDRAQRPTVGFHPTCHLELFEQRGYERLHSLTATLVGQAHGLIALADLQALAEPLGALLLELPQREIGGPLPDWDDLVAQTDWARERGTAVHLDGARLWECGPHYGRPYAEIVGLFDSVYVSFYKGLGGLAGCCLAGPQRFVDEARVWRRRHGGTLFTMWPYAVTGLAGLRRHLPRMPEYAAHAAAVAEALADVPGVEVVPGRPPTPLMHLILATGEERFAERAVELAQDEGLWTWRGAQPTGSPSHVRVELYAGEATLGFPAAEVARLLDRLVS